MIVLVWEVMIQREQSWRGNVFVLSNNKPLPPQAEEAQATQAEHFGEECARAEPRPFAVQVARHFLSGRAAQRRAQGPDHQGGGRTAEEGGEAYRRLRLGPPFHRRCTKVRKVSLADYSVDRIYRGIC